MSELSRGVAMEVTQPSCLFFFTFVFVGYYYEEEEENVSHKTRFTPTHMMRRRLRRRRRKIHHCHHQKGSRRRMKMIDDDDDFLNLIRLYKRRKKIQQNRAYIKKVKTYETRTRKPTLRGRLLKLKFPYLCFISLLLLAFVKTSWCFLLVKRV